MKKIVIVLLSLMLFTSCANDKDFVNKNTNSFVTETVNAIPYGLFDQENKIDGIQYKISVGNVILSAIFIETAVVPVILIGWYLWEPVSVKDKSKVFKKKLKPSKELDDFYN